jgi:hypothetical protein
MAACTLGREAGKIPDIIANEWRCVGVQVLERCLAFVPRIFPTQGIANPPANGRVLLRDKGILIQVAGGNARLLRITMCSLHLAETLKAENQVFNTEDYRAAVRAWVVKQTPISGPY